MSFETLIVDDDALIIFIHKKLVARNGFPSEPKTFLNGLTALEDLLNQPTSDTQYLVLLDINMPVMTGWEFLDRIQNQPIAERVKVAMVTSSVDRSDKVKAETYPQVVSFLEKPVSNDMLQTLKSHFTK